MQIIFAVSELHKSATNPHFSNTGMLERVVARCHEVVRTNTLVEAHQLLWVPLVGLPSITEIL
jgi:hypothetical protein